MPDKINTYKDKPVLKSAPPPWHTVATVVLVLLVSIALLPNQHDFDRLAVPETFTKRVFPNVISAYTLGWIRGFMAFVIWSTCLSMIFSAKGDEFEIPYLPGSQLKQIVIKLYGIKTMFPFTSWAWIFLGINFTLSSYVSFQISASYDVSKILLRLVIAFWEISAPFTIMVSAVVRYVMWPRSLASKDTTNFTLPHVLLQHNANVLFAVIETTILSGMPVRWQDMSLAPIIGCIYIIFSWSMVMNWSKAEDGPQFLYFFLDTTMPGYTTTFAALGLLAVLIASYAVFVMIEYVLMQISETGILTHIIFAFAVSSSVMRFRD